MTVQRYYFYRLVAPTFSPFVGFFLAISSSPFVGIFLGTFFGFLKKYFSE